MQIKIEQKNKLLLVHQTCLVPGSDENRHPRGTYYQKVPCVCERCGQHFQNGQMTFWISENLKTEDEKNNS